MYIFIYVFIEMFILKYINKKSKCDFFCFTFQVFKKVLYDAYTLFFFIYNVIIYVEIKNYGKNQLQKQTKNGSYQKKNLENLKLTYFFLYCYEYVLDFKYESN